MKIKNDNIAIIIADYYKQICEGLLSGAIDVLKKNDLQYSLYKAPGAFEIPQIINQLIRKESHNCFIALGCVIKGETYHFETISDSVAQELLRLANNSEKVLITNGILNVYDQAQAIGRSGNDSKNKGAEAASALLASINCLK